MTTPKIIRDRQGERGNVLFLILIAVALFAALSYAVTQSTRSGSGDASGETNLINSAQLAQYPAGIRTSVVRMIIGGVAVEQLIFDTPAAFPTMNVSDIEFSVFHPQGGGGVFQKAPTDLMVSGASGNWIYSSAYEISGIGLTNGTGTGNDIIAFLPGVGQNVCKKLNEEIGITSANADGIPNDSTITPIPTEEMLSTNRGIDGYVGTIAGSFVGQPFGCFRVGAINASFDASNGYVYYHVLVER